MLDPLLEQITPRRRLNDGPHPTGRVDASAVAGELALLRLRLRSDLLTGSPPARWFVDADARFAELAAPLQGLTPDALADRATRFSFWINAYNALVAHAMIASSARPPLRRVPGLYRRFGWNIGGADFTPDAIEHGVLRANRGHPRLPGPAFFPHDPRRRWSIDSFDARVHATLHCGAASCPTVQRFEAERFEPQLAWAWEGWVRASTHVAPVPRRVRVHPILWSHRGDFGGVEGLLDAIGAGLEDEDAERLRTLRREGPLDVGPGPTDPRVAL